MVVSPSVATDDSNLKIAMGDFRPSGDHLQVSTIIGTLPQPTRADCCQCLLDHLFGEDVCEGKVTFLSELTPQKTHLLPKPSLVTILHRMASLPVMDLWLNLSTAREAFLPISFWPNGLPRT